MKNDMNLSVGTALADCSADFMGAARKLANEKGIGITGAMRRVSREQPELHQAFLRKAQQANLEKKSPGVRGKGNKEFMAVVRAHAKQTGATMTESMRQVAHKDPWLFQGDFPEPATTSHRPKVQDPPEEIPFRSTPVPGFDNSDSQDDLDDDDDDDDAEHVSESRNTVGGELANLPGGMQAESSTPALLPDGSFASVSDFSDVRGPAPVAASPVVLCL